ncbi:MAG TPA: hypothetical protein VKT77_19940, partial [Chthonomonadaceae bacterium]|nr:hypothetical protein [Chthonomonadaceae bacterium]
GRPNGGALDALFGIRHDPAITAKGVFGGPLWCETDQDANYGYKSYHDLLTNANGCLKDASGFHKAVRAMPVETMRQAGPGRAVLLNLSPQWYNAYRVEGRQAAARRDIFMRHIVGTLGPRRWVALDGDPDALFGHEITYFRAPGGRMILYVCWNPEIGGTEAGGGNAVGLKSGPVDCTLKFGTPVRSVCDERRGIDLGRDDHFKFAWRRNEAIVLSFDRS